MLQSGGGWRGARGAIRARSAHSAAKVEELAIPSHMLPYITPSLPHVAACILALPYLHSHVLHRTPKQKANPYNCAACLQRFHWCVLSPTPARRPPLGPVPTTALAAPAPL